jgi:hypothetical protein
MVARTIPEQAQKASKERVFVHHAGALAREFIPAAMLFG